jgi:hypothetical protein
MTLKGSNVGLPPNLRTPRPAHFLLSRELPLLDLSCRNLILLRMHPP